MFRLNRRIAGCALGIMVTWPMCAQARVTLWEDDFEDNNTNCWTIQSAGVSVGVDGSISNSGDYSLEVAGNSSAGQGAIVTSRVLPIDFTRPYTLQLAFRYDSFHWDRFAIFGHIRLLIDYPNLPMLHDPVGDNSFVGNRVSETSFQTYLSANAWGWITVHCDPVERSYAVFINGTHVGTVDYQAGVVPSSQFWFEDNHSSSNYLNAHYDDFAVWGFLDPQQCPYAIAGAPFDPDDCAAWVHPPTVPYHGQYTRANQILSEPCCPPGPNGRCVVACLHMLFDYYGDVLPAGGGNVAGPQEEIEAAANTNDRVNCPQSLWSGTWASDARRAGHCSSQTKSLTGIRAGCPPQGCPNQRGVNGYGWRSLGYAAYDSIWTDLAPEDTVDEAASSFPFAIETLIGSGYPLIALVNGNNLAGWLEEDLYEGEQDTTIIAPENTDCGHALLLIGYDNVGRSGGNPHLQPSFQLHDPALGRFLWIRQQTFWDSVWTSKRFVAAAPWEVMWLSPPEWCHNATFDGSALITYTGPDPLDGLFGVNNASAALTLTNVGLQGGEVNPHALNAIQVSGDWDFTTWSLRFAPWVGVPAAGAVLCSASGILSPAASSASYQNYADQIGGATSASQSIGRCFQIDPYDPGHFGWPYGGHWWSRAGGAGLRTVALGGGLYEVSATIGNFGSEPIPAGAFCQVHYADPSLAQCAPGGNSIGIIPLPSLGPGDTLTVGPLMWQSPPANGLGQPHFAFFSTIEAPGDPHESVWPQDENNHATLCEYDISAEPDVPVELYFWVENPELTAREVRLAVARDAGASGWEIVTDPPTGMPLVLGPGEALPGEVHILPTVGDSIGTVQVECFLYVPGGEFIRETGGLGVTLHLPPTASIDRAAGFEAHLVLAPNHPNPFSDETMIRFCTGAAGPVQLRIYDIGGRLVRNLVTESLLPGWHQLSWSGRDDHGLRAASGLYLYRLEDSNGAQRSRRMIFLPH